MDGLCAGYGSVQVLERISLAVNDGETVTLLGTNGNGKSTLMKCIMGIVPPTAGRINATIDGVEHDLVGRPPEQIVDLGIVLVPEGRRLFPRLTVEENLLLGAFRRSARGAKPSVGLAPILVIHTIDKIRELKESYGLTVLMAEQNFNQAIRIADRGYVIVHGRIEYESRSREELADNELVHKLYMGL